MPYLMGEKIMLRDYRKEDLEHMRRWVNDPEITNYLSDVFLYPHAYAQTESFLTERMEGKGEAKGFVIAERDSEAYIGQIDLFRFDWKNRSAELGVVIGRKELLGKGFGTEALFLLQEFVFDSLNLHRLELRVSEHNRRAYRAYVKSGFKEEGRLRERLYLQGRYVDVILMSILKREYEERKRKATS